MPTYTYATLKNSVSSKIQGRVGNLLNDGTIIYCFNSAARKLFTKIDLRSAKRKSSLSPNLFNDIYDYNCPSDLKGIKVIDIIPQINRSRYLEWVLTTPEEFDRHKDWEKTLFCVWDNDFVRRLRISAIADMTNTDLTISELDSLTSGGGTWAGYGDAENLRVDSDNYVKGNASINWDISNAGGTTAGIYNDDLDEFDLSDYIYSGSVFIWVYITDSTNITNFILRIGSSASAYYTKTITTNNEGVSFYDGWNLLRFDLYTATTSGSPVATTCNYVALYMTKDAGKVSETDYRFDWLVVKRGAIHDVLYYTKYPWQTSGGTYLENATAVTDKLNADTEEFDLLVTECTIEALQELGDYNEAAILKKLQDEDIKNYIMNYPSEAKLLINTYHEFEDFTRNRHESILNEINKIEL